MDRIYIKLESEAQTYNIRPPYIKNLNNVIQRMYPVLKGNGAHGGSVNPQASRHILLEFNCLGIKTTDDVTMVIESEMYSPVTITFRKECSDCKLPLFS